MLINNRTFLCAAALVFTALTPARAVDPERTGHIINASEKHCVFLSKASTSPVFISWIDTVSSTPMTRVYQHPFFHIIPPGGAVSLELPVAPRPGVLEFTLMADKPEGQEGLDSIAYAFTVNPEETKEHRDPATLRRLPFAPKRGLTRRLNPLVITFPK